MYGVRWAPSDRWSINQVRRGPKKPWWAGRGRLGYCPLLSGSVLMIPAHLESVGLSPADFEPVRPLYGVRWAPSDRWSINQVRRGPKKPWRAGSGRLGCCPLLFVSVLMIPAHFESVGLSPADFEPVRPLYGVRWAPSDRWSINQVRRGPKKP